MFSKPIAAVALVSLLSLSGPALAEGEPISVKVNMARVLRISAPAATVIVGNPGVADVTIQDPLTLVLTGKTYGQTNLIVLNASGNPIADTVVNVVEDKTADLVTVFNAGARVTFSCANHCSPTVTLGDDPSYSQQLAQSLNVIKSVQN